MRNTEFENSTRNTNKVAANTGKTAVKGVKSAKKGAKATAKGAKAAAKGAKATASAVGKFATTFPYATLIIIVVVFVLILLGGIVGNISQVEMNDVFHLTPLGQEDYNKPSEKDKEDSIWNKDVVIKENAELLNIVAEYKKASKDSIMNQIAADCEANGWDSERTFSHIKENNAIGYVPSDKLEDSSQNKDDKKEDDNKKPPSKKGSVIKDFPLDGLTTSQKSTFRWEEIDREWNGNTIQRKLYDSGKWYIDEYGLAKFKNDDGTEDYMCAMGSYFGDTGNRYRISFDNGTVATFLKFDAKQDKHTEGGSGIAGLAGDVIEFMINEKKLSPIIRYTGDVANHPEKIFGTITKIELIEGSVDSSIMKGFSRSDSSFLAAFSVSMDNLMYVKDKDKYKNNKGSFLDLSWLNSKHGDVDVHKELRKKLDKFSHKGSFYELSYEKNTDGSIKLSEDRVEEQIEVEKTKYVKDEKTGKKKKVTYTETETKVTVYKYAVPTIKELPLNSIAEDVFDIDPNEKYVNGGKSDITNREMIQNMANATASMLFGVNTGGSGEILPSDFNGKYAWPAPGVKIITSPFGLRIHPLTGVYTGHQGVDIGTPMNTNIIAAEEGVVSLAGPYGGYGICVDITHPDGNTTRYGHLNEALVTQGQKVSKGEVIALSGNTGDSTGPHLHFEVREGGTTPVEPLSYVCTLEEYRSLLQY